MKYTGVDDGPMCRHVGYYIRIYVSVGRGAWTFKYLAIFNAKEIQKISLRMAVDLSAYHFIIGCVKTI